MECDLPICTTSNKKKKKKPTQVLAFSFLFCFFNLFFSLSKCAVSTRSSVALPLCSNTFNPPRCLCSGLRRRARSLTLCSRSVAWQFDVQGHYSHICSLLVQSARTHSNSQRNLTIKKTTKQHVHAGLLVGVTLFISSFPLQTSLLSTSLNAFASSSAVVCVVASQSSSSTISF